MKTRASILSILSLVLLTIGCSGHKPYSLSQCAYCGAISKASEGKTTITESTFPSNNPPEHMHLFIPLAGLSGQMFWDARSDATDVLHQLQELHSQGQLSEDIIQEWFSINVGNPEALKAFADKHNLKLKLTGQNQSMS